MKRSCPAVFKVVTGIVLLLIALGGCMIRNVVGPGDITKVEDRLSEQINTQNDPGLRSDLYLQRARLRLRYDNPRADYYGALADLRNAVALQPTREDAEDLKDLIAVLDRLSSLEQEADTLKTKQIRAEQEIRTLQNNIEQIEKQKQALQKKIEDLKSLELQMEQLRQRVR